MVFTCIHGVFTGIRSVFTRINSAFKGVNKVCTGVNRVFTGLSALCVIKGFWEIRRGEALPEKMLVAHQVGLEVHHTVAGNGGRGGDVDVHGLEQRSCGLLGKRGGWQ